MFRVQQIDHIELSVPDQYEAAEWYRNVFGLEIIPEFEYWAESGPLMITTQDAGTKLALFKGNPPQSVAGFKRVAFRVDGESYMTFLNRLDTLELAGNDGIQLTATNAPVDHSESWSLYFRDPWGYPYEITTYDYDYVDEQLSHLESK